MSRQDDLKMLIIKWERRLQRLKEHQAQYGSFTDPGVLAEIEDIEKSIEPLQTELQRLNENPSNKTEIMSKVADWLRGETFCPSPNSDASKKAEYYLAALVIPVMLGVIIGLMFGAGLETDVGDMKAFLYANTFGVSTIIRYWPCPMTLLWPTGSVFLSLYSVARPSL